jgi:hypothetical protein
LRGSFGKERGRSKIEERKLIWREEDGDQASRTKLARNKGRSDNRDEGMAGGTPASDNERDRKHVG